MHICAFACSFPDTPAGVRLCQGRAAPSWYRRRPGLKSSAWHEAGALEALVRRLGGWLGTVTVSQRVNGGLTAVQE